MVETQLCKLRGTYTIIYHAWLKQVIHPRSKKKKKSEVSVRTCQALTDIIPVKTFQDSQLKPTTDYTAISYREASARTLVVLDEDGWKRQTMSV